MTQQIPEVRSGSHGGRQEEATEDVETNPMAQSSSLQTDKPMSSELESTETATLQEA